MERRYLLGNAAIAHACTEAGVDFVSGYPGTPSSEVIDTLRVVPDRTYYIEWSVNEKVALENALAAAWCGIRALCTMKHVGLNVAADPLMTSAYTGVTGGLVIMSADDPFAHSSQNEHDSRIYAHFARLPCLDPAGVQEAHDMIPKVFLPSEELGLPVIFRPTTRLCHSKGDVELGPAVAGTRKGEFKKDPRQYVVIPAPTRILHKKLNEKQPGIRKRLVEKGFNRYEIRGRNATIASGIGCYTLGLQIGVVDTCLCMGASIRVASGIAHSGEPREVVCTIGYSTFLHTGIQGLMNALYNGADITAVILENRTTVMTGHQPNPNTGETAWGVKTPPVSLDAVCRACGVNFVETVDPYDVTGMLNVFQEASKRWGVKVVIAKQMCVITARCAGVKRGRYAADEEACTGCQTCVRFGCPAIEFSDEKARITDLCSGCSVCAQLCPAGAIVWGGER